MLLQVGEEQPFCCVMESRKYSMKQLQVVKQRSDESVDAVHQIMLTSRKQLIRDASGDP